MDEVHEPPQHISSGALFNSMEQYRKVYQESVEDPDAFWGKIATESLSWFVPWTKVRSGNFVRGDIAWFLDGKLNVSYNCLDRHLEKRADQVAILWEGDEPGNVRKVTYGELFRDVCQISNIILSEGLRKGDTVALYMPNVPEAAAAMLACTRIGVVHNVVFGGFSSESLAARIQDAKAKLVITADEGKRGGKTIPLKATVDQALEECPTVQRVYVLKRNAFKSVHMKAGRDLSLRDEMDKSRPYCPAVWLDSEDPLFLLYTSGSTGKPKGVVHTQAGYLLHASFTHRTVFDWREGDVYACAADIGWITGHSYLVYGPLCNGATSFMFEGVPTYPDASRYWDMVQRHRITQLYTAPTAIRALMKFGDSFVASHDRSSLRILGSVGEPINPEAWRWYHNVVGNGKCAVVDTYWQTETGGHLISSLPGATPTKPGSASLPLFGIQLAVLDPQSGQILMGNDVKGILAVKSSWPGMARSVFGDHVRYLETYMKPYPGYYFTGDGVRRDKDGYYWIEGRVDDVINVSGHRIGTAEVESAMVAHGSVAEAAAVGFPHEIKGQGIAVYCILRDGNTSSHAQLEQELKLQVRKVIGPFAMPDLIIFTPALPKVRSGKIMRRILRKIVAKETSPEQLGDVSALADPEIVQSLITTVNALLSK